VPSPKTTILQNIDFTEFYEEHLDWDGQNNVECPFADEKHEKGSDSNPSLSINPEKGSVYCHSCGYKCSSPIGFIEDYKKIPYEKVCEQLYSEYVEPVIPKSIVEKYHKKLITNPKRLKKLLKLRGITKRTVERYQLGWKDGRVWIPIFNAYNFCVNVRRHDILHKLEHKILSYKKGYGKARLYPANVLEHDKLILCGGELDALLINQLGFAGVSTTGGESVWTEDFSKDLAGKTIYIFPDNDKAGRDGALKKKKMLEGIAESVTIVKLPVKKKKEDFTDWVVKYKGNADYLKRILAEVTPKGKAKTNGVKEDEPEKKNYESDGMKSQRIGGETALDDLLKDGSFFKDENGSIFYANKRWGTINLEPKYAFMAYLQQENAALNMSTGYGRFVYEHIRGYAQIKGAQTQLGYHSLYRDATIFLAINKAQILKISPGKRELIKNALNKDGILMKKPEDILDIEYDRKAKFSDSVKWLWKNFCLNSPMNDLDRVYFLCWLIFSPMRQYCTAKPIMRIQAKTAAGKSTTTKMVSSILYGQNLLNSMGSSLAAGYETGKTHPVFIMDNLEVANLNQPLIDFLLSISTEATKQKRTLNTDTGVTIERLAGLCLMNGIEPLTKKELNSRIVELQLNPEKYGLPYFNEIAIFEEIKKMRSTVLSGITKGLAQNILTRINRGEGQEYARQIGSHSKERFNDYFGAIGIIWEEIWKYIPHFKYKSAKEMFQAWIKKQDKISEISHKETNQVVHTLDALALKHKLIGEQCVCSIRRMGDQITISGTMQDLYLDFQTVCKLQGAKMEWSTERQLGVRIKDSMEILIDAGWKISKKKINGRKINVYEKKFPKENKA